MIYYHDIRDSAPWSVLAQVCGQTLSGLDLYSGRALGVAMPEDVVVIPRGSEADYRWVTEHYNQVGLSHAGRVLVDGPDILPYLKGKRDVSVFYFSSRAHEIWPDHFRQPTVEHLNNKNYFLDILCPSLEIPTPVTVAINYQREVSIPERFPVYVKLAVSATGLGIWRCEDEDQFRSALARVGTLPFQVQDALPVGTDFYNIQYRRDALDRLSVVVTRQIMDGSHHDGNYYPVMSSLAKRIETLTASLADWAVVQGMREVWAYDVAHTPDDQLLLMECNPRWNGSTYPTIIAEKLGVPEWEMRNLTTSRITLVDLNLDDLEYRPERGFGVVIVNWGPVKIGKIGVLFIGSPAERMSARECLLRRLHV